MNLSLKLKTLLWVGLCVGSVILSSCEDEESEVGLNLQNPGNKAIVFNDSLTSLYTYTYQQADSIYLTPANLLLGYNVDDKLGSFQNNFMTEVSLSSYNVSFGNNPVATEMVLYLKNTATYGDTSQMQTITIYELTKDLPLNDTANSIHGRPMDKSVVAEYYNPTPITTFSFTPSPSDTLPIKIVLPESFMNRFLDTIYYSSLDTFQRNVFRGFYFEANPIASGGAISYFGVGAKDSSRMELSYRNDSDTLIYTYNINQYNYRCNIFYREYNPLINYIPKDELNPDTNSVQELFYIKFNNAFEARIDITGLQDWADSNFVYTINKAVLDIYSLEPVTVLDSIYFPLPPLLLYQVNDLNEKIPLDEYINTQNNTYINIPQDTLSGGYGYHLVINKTLYNTIQNGDDKLRLVLTTDSKTNMSYPNRVILKGKINTDQPLKLKLTYTKLNVD